MIKWYESPWVAILIFAMGYMVAAALFLIHAIKHAVQFYDTPTPKQRAIVLVEPGRFVVEPCGRCEHGTPFTYACIKCDDADMVEDFFEKLSDPPFTTYN